MKYENPNSPTRGISMFKVVFLTDGVWCAIEHLPESDAKEEVEKNLECDFYDYGEMAALLGIELNDSMDDPHHVLLEAIESYHSLNQVEQKLQKCLRLNQVIQ